MTAKVGSFIEGLRGEHTPLDKVLSGKVVDKKYRLIDLKRDNVTYNRDSQTVTIHRPDAANSIHVPVREAFHDYMEQHGDSVRYMTRNGTPWLSEEEKADKQKTEDYFSALKSGPKNDITIINWRKTDGRTRDTGHSAVSVGKLMMGDAHTPDGKPVDPRPIEEYDQHAGGSFYPSPSLWRDRKAMSHTKTLDMGEHDPSAHARGVLVRNTIKPSAAAAAAGAAVGLASYAGRKRTGGAVRAVLKAAAVATATYTAGYVTGSLQTSPGSIKIKDEEHGHGMLATLISPAQHDILEHNLVGLSNTYHGKYNVFKSNCADFAEDMMELIGLNTHELVQTAMETQPESEAKPRRRPGERAVPHHIRPDRNSWALRRLQSGEEGFTEVEGQEVCMQKLSVSGQSTLLIETTDGTPFKHMPMEMLSKVLAKGVGITAPQGESRAEFAYHDHVRQPAAQDRQR